MKESIYSAAHTKFLKEKAEQLIAETESEVGKRAVALALDVTLRPYRRARRKSWRR